MALTIPTIFTAIDKFTAPLEKMQRSVGSFGGASESAAARLDRRFRKLSDSAQSVALKSGAAALAIAAPIGLAVNKAIEYEDKLANFKAITGATGKEFVAFADGIDRVSVASGKSKLAVVDAYTAISNNMPDLLKDPKGLEDVTRATIQLAKAGKMELGPAGDNLTTIMNQFGAKAAEVTKIVDNLAAGSVAGSSEIYQTADAIQKMGTVANAAGVKINESVTLVELASQFEKGAEAGTKLRNMLSKMSNASVLPPEAQVMLKKAGVNIALVSDKTVPLNDRLLEMQKILKVTGGVTKVFGEENAGLATGVLTNAGAFQKMYDQINTGGQAAKMAAENENTLKARLEKSKAAMDNMMIAAGQGLIPALTDLFEAINPIITKVTKWMSENKELTKTIMKIALGVAAFLAIVSVISTIISVVSGGIAAFAAMNGIFVAIAAFVTSTLIPILQVIWVVIEAVVASVLSFFGISAGLFAALVVGIALVATQFYVLYNNWNRIVAAFQNGGIIEGLKAIGTTMIDMILFPLQKILMLASKLPKSLGGGLAADAAKGLAEIRSEMGVSMSTEDKALINPKKAEQDALMSKQETNTNKTVTIDFKNMPKGVQATGDAIANGIMPNLGSTMGFSN